MISRTLILRGKIGRSFANALQFNVSCSGSDSMLVQQITTDPVVNSSWRQDSSPVIAGHCLILFPGWSIISCNSSAAEANRTTDERQESSSSRNGRYNNPNPKLKMFQTRSAAKFSSRHSKSHRDVSPLNTCFPMVWSSSPALRSVTPGNAPSSAPWAHPMHHLATTTKYIHFFCAICELAVLCFILFKCIFYMAI